MNNKKWTDVKKIIEDTDDLGLGKYYSNSIENDIKHLGFVFARYKFAAKMMERRKGLRILELGCSYGLGAQFFNQTKACEFYCGVDLDDEAIDYATRTFGNDKTLFIRSDFLAPDFSDSISLSFSNQRYDAVISLDVIEHIEKEKERDYVKMIRENLKDAGFVIIGTPNIMMTPYASAASKAAHINMYDYERLYSLLGEYFRNVFMFGMNDEVLHTGFAPMSCYIFALCTV